MPATTLLFSELTKLQRIGRGRLNLDQERRRLQKKLRDHGAVRIASGRFGSAYAFEGKVLKIVATAHNHGYLMYARIARARSRSCPLLPRVNRIMAVGRYSVVHMERLYHDTRQARRSACALQAAIFNAAPLSRAARVMRREERAVTCVWHAIRALQRRRPRSALDLHEGNILFRRERGRLRAVITDPVTW